MTQQDPGAGGGQLSGWSLTTGGPRPWIASLILVLAVSALYGQFLWNPIVFDDTYFFMGSNAEDYGHSAFSLDLRWLPYASLGWTRNLFGLELDSFRIGNLLLHGAVTVALFIFLRRLFQCLPWLEDRSTGRLSPAWIAFFAALIFALHPVAVYGAAYLIQRTILMATLFSLLMWLSYLEGLVRRSWPWFVVSGVCYFLAVFSKEHSVMAPLVALALSFLVVKVDRQVAGRMVLPGLIFLIIGGVVVMKKVGILGAPYELMGPEMLASLASEQGADGLEHVHLLSVMTQAWLFFKYLFLWLLPWPGWMSVDMREPFATGLGAWPQSAGFVAFVVYGLVALWLLLKGGRQRLAGFAMLTPWLLFFTEFAAVRVQESFVLYRSYLWMVGLFAALPLLLWRVPARWGFLLLLGISVLMVPLAWDRLQSFSHPLLLWDDAARLAEGKTGIVGMERIYYNRANALANVNMHAEALADYDRAIATNPGQMSSYQNRGVALLKLSRFDEAIADFQQAIELGSQQANTFYALALAYLGRGDTDSAMPYLQRACAGGFADACSQLDARIADPSMP